MKAETSKKVDKQSRLGRLAAYQKQVKKRSKKKGDIRV